jgi:hypothetical protein
LVYVPARGGVGGPENCNPFFHDTSSASGLKAFVTQWGIGPIIFEFEQPVPASVSAWLMRDTSVRSSESEVRLEAAQGFWEAIVGNADIFPPRPRYRQSFALSHLIHTAKRQEKRQRWLPQPDPSSYMPLKAPHSGAATL